MKRLGVLCSAVAIIVLFVPGCSRPSVPDEARSDPEPPRLYQSVKTVTIPYRLFGHAKKAGGLLYVSVCGNDEGIIDRIITLDPETGEEEIVITSDNDIAWLEVSEEWIVWETNMDMYAQPRTGGERLLLGGVQAVFGPVLEGSLVAWMNRVDDDRYQLTVRDLNGGENRVIAENNHPGLYNNFVHIEGDRLLWTDIIDNTGFYRVASLRDGTIEDYPIQDTDFRFPGYAQLSGDRLYSINFDTYIEWDWTKQRFGYYSIPDGTFTALRDKNFIQAFRVSGDRVAILETGHRLTLMDAAASQQAEDISKAFGTIFDSLDCADSNTFVASLASKPGEPKKATLYLISVR